MRIKYITEDDLNTIKANLNSVYKEVVKTDDKSLNDFFNKENIIRETANEISDFSLDMSQPAEKAYLTDAENCKRVYGHMKFLSDSQASDERIWAAYTFSVFLNYMKYRWPAKSAIDLNNNYLFGYSRQRSLFRNGVSRLWWIGRMSYDESRDDPYELTEFLCKKQDVIESICGRNVFNNQDIRLATLKALFDADKSGIKIERILVRDIAKYVNLLAGIYLIDAFDKDEIYSKICKKIGFQPKG